MQIEVTRDSVCAGDDVDAPHTQRFSFDDALSLDDVIDAIARGRYLAHIKGGRATWSAHAAGRALAVVAQEWSAARRVTERRIEWPEITDRDGIVRLHFEYHAQKSPDLVSESLRVGSG